jgi:hypothetical protein
MNFQSFLFGSWIVIYTIGQNGLKSLRIILRFRNSFILKERDHLEDLGVDVRLILRRILGQ